jgi:hypothetical protein
MLWFVSPAMRGISCTAPAVVRPIIDHTMIMGSYRASSDSLVPHPNFYRPDLRPDYNLSLVLTAVMVVYIHREMPVLASPYPGSPGIKGIGESRNFFPSKILGKSHSLELLFTSKGSSMLVNTCTMPYVFGTAPQGGQCSPKLFTSW